MREALLVAGVVGGIVLLAVFISLFFGLISGTIFYFLWNWLAPLVWAGAPAFSWLEAVGIWFLVGMIGRLIFGRSSSGKSD